MSMIVCGYMPSFLFREFRVGQDPYYNVYLSNIYKENYKQIEKHQINIIENLESQFYELNPLN